ncbi:hypothetical protein L596_004689 [Steinernema carpocapsae]|uniref:Uncharacterized protein n=1 Tax=Steinernema carpocapsae TaxID=34508 RepID=A0A4U8UWK5_STECR|nr:hypothetical protein L596_004689 [Steinernema carpocapsae]
MFSDKSVPRFDAPLSASFLTLAKVSFICGRVGCQKDRSEVVVGNSVGAYTGCSKSSGTPFARSICSECGLR